METLRPKKHGSWRHIARLLAYILFRVEWLPGYCGFTVFLVINPLKTSIFVKSKETIVSLSLLFLYIYIYIYISYKYNYIRSRNMVFKSKNAQLEIPGRTKLGILLLNTK